MMKKIFKNYYVRSSLLFLVLLLGYSYSNTIFRGSSGLFRMEIPLTLYLYVTSLFWLRPSPYRAVLAMLPLALFYFIYDFYFVTYNALFNFIQINKIGELLEVIDWKYTLILVLMALLTMVYIFSLRWSKKAGVFTSPLVLLVLLLLYQPESIQNGFRTLSKEFVGFSIVKNTRKNGRLVMSIYSEAERRFIQNNLDRYRSKAYFSMLLDSSFKDKVKKRNVHLIVLESYIDPTLLQKISPSQDPKSEAYHKLFDTKENLSHSPVFGGNTSQAEFEVLCGVPAFNRVSSAEFNVFSGKESYCMPTILRALGYKSYASNAYKPYFFNTVKAYQSIGFDAQYFPDIYTDKPTYIKQVGELKDMFDGDLFDQNIAFVKEKMKEGKPVLNYVLGIYGHDPYEIHKKHRLLIDTKTDNVVLDRVYNQYMYRTAAITRYVKQLMEIDPESIIVLVADHLPPLDKENIYKKYGYKYDLSLNRLLVIDHSKVIKLPQETSHYNIYRYILNSLSDGYYCEEKACAVPFKEREKLLDDYYSILSFGTS